MIPSPEVSEEHRKELAKVSSFLEDMEHFLRNVPHGRGQKVVSRDNCRSVMGQVRKLVLGIPITYRHWKKGVEFYVEGGTHLGTDFEALLEQAKEFEAQHGRDRGNGWLLRHPIQKLSYFQEYTLKTKVLS